MANSGGIIQVEVAMRERVYFSWGSQSFIEVTFDLGLGDDKAFSKHLRSVGNGK
jgi:hypothetical protein